MRFQQTVLGYLRQGRLLVVRGGLLCVCLSGEGVGFGRSDGQTDARRVGSRCPCRAWSTRSAERERPDNLLQLLLPHYSYLPGPRAAWKTRFAP